MLFLVQKELDFDGALSDYLLPITRVTLALFDNLAFNTGSRYHCGGWPPSLLQPGDRGWINILEGMDIVGAKTIVGELTVFIRMLLFAAHVLLADVGILRCHYWGEH